MVLTVHTVSKQQVVAEGALIELAIGVNLGLGTTTQLLSPVAHTCNHEGPGTRPDICATNEASAPGEQAVEAEARQLMTPKATIQVPALPLVDASASRH